MITLFLGGNKSGKSSHALECFLAAPGPHRLLVTGKAMDMAFRHQIIDHKRERPASLAVHEVNADLPAALDKAKQEAGSALADSLDYWLFTCINSGLQEEKTAELVALLSDWSGPELFLVSCEVGLGPIAGDSATRTFVRNLGALNQTIARLADSVYLVAAGLPLKLK